MQLDIFRGDAFGLVPLVKAINDIEYAPTKIQKAGWFRNEGINTTKVTIERQKDKLSLVPSAPRGAPGVVKGLQRRNMRTLEAVHLPQQVSMLADEVMGLRAFGTQSDEEAAMVRLKRKMAVARRDLDITIEYQRMGAIKGQVLDADGATVLLDLFEEFGVTKSELAMVLGTSTTKVLQKCVTIERMVEDKLGGLMFSGLRAQCSPEYLDAFTSHPVVQDAWRYYQAHRNAENYRGGFDFGGIIWEEYRGTVGGTRYIAAGKAHVVPEGVPDLFTSFYAPPNHMDLVGTDGLPYYAFQEDMDFKAGVQVATQSNPLHICERPDAIIELSL